MKPYIKKERPLLNCACGCGREFKWSPRQPKQKFATRRCYQLANRADTRAKRRRAKLKLHYTGHGKPWNYLLTPDQDDRAESRNYFEAMNNRIPCRSYKMACN